MCSKLIPFFAILYISASSGHFITISATSGHSITVDVNAEECFFVKVEAGTNMSLIYDMVEEGFLGIQVRIVDPDDKVIYRTERATSDEHTFSAHTAGTYTYCFSKKWTLIDIMFSMAIEESPTAEAEGENSNKLENAFRELSASRSGFEQELEDKLVFHIRMVMWFVFALLILVAIMLQYLTRVLEVRREV